MLCCCCWSGGGAASGASGWLGWSAAELLWWLLLLLICETAGTLGKVLLKLLLLLTLLLLSVTVSAFFWPKMAAAEADECAATQIKKSAASKSGRKVKWGRWEWMKRGYDREEGEVKVWEEGVEGKEEEEEEKREDERWFAEDVGALHLLSERSGRSEAAWLRPVLATSSFATPSSPSSPTERLQSDIAAQGHRLSGSASSEHGWVELVTQSEMEGTEAAAAVVSSFLCEFVAEANLEISFSSSGAPLSSELLRRWGIRRCGALFWNDFSLKGAACTVVLAIVVDTIFAECIVRKLSGLLFETHKVCKVALPAVLCGWKKCVCVCVCAHLHCNCSRRMNESNDRCNTRRTSGERKKKTNSNRYCLPFVWVCVCVCTNSTLLFFFFLFLFCLQPAQINNLEVSCYCCCCYHYCCPAAAVDFRAAEGQTLGEEMWEEGGWFSVESQMPGKERKMEATVRADTGTKWANKLCQCHNGDQFQ